MSHSFGFDLALGDVEKYTRRGRTVKQKVGEYADLVVTKAQSIATSRGLFKTGAGVGGIEKEDKGSGYDVGWANRPNFHLYFHEIGFHALDNRHGKQRIKRDSKGKRQRSYRGSRATYVAPTPHLRPAWDQLEGKYYAEIQRYLAGE